MEVSEVIFSVLTEKLWWECRNLVEGGGRFATLEDLIVTCRNSTNRTSAFSVRWVEKANRVLAGSEGADG